MLWVVLTSRAAAQASALGGRAPQTCFHPPVGSRERLRRSRRRGTSEQEAGQGRCALSPLRHSTERARPHREGRSQWWWGRCFGTRFRTGCSLAELPATSQCTSPNLAMLPNAARGLATMRLERRSCGAHPFWHTPSTRVMLQFTGLPRTNFSLSALLGNNLHSRLGQRNVGTELIQIDKQHRVRTGAPLCLLRPTAGSAPKSQSVNGERRHSSLLCQRRSQRLRVQHVLGPHRTTNAAFCLHQRIAELIAATAAEISTCLPYPLFSGAVDGFRESRPQELGADLRHRQPLRLGLYRGEQTKGLRRRHRR